MELPNDLWWVEGFCVKYQPCASIDKYVYGIVPTYASDLYIIEIDSETLCQYIGLTDKNGKKIWENDYISCKQYIGGNQIDYAIELGYVEMKHGAFGLHREQGYYRPFKDWLEDYEYEIIGNIFDDPELFSR